MSRSEGGGGVLRPAVAGAGSVLRVLVLGALGLLLGFLVLSFLLAAISERHDVCACRDGGRAAGWAWALRSPASHCAELCREHGGGEAVRPPPGRPKRR